MQGLVNLGGTDPAESGSMGQPPIGQAACQGVTQALELVQVAVAAQHCQGLLPLVQGPFLHKPCAAQQALKGLQEQGFSMLRKPQKLLKTTFMSA